jgi:S1-C subfamily serine protease
LRAWCALGSGNRRAGQGSGVVFTPDGYLLTNSHVAGGAKEFHVSLPNGMKSAARLIGDDPETDLAVLRMETADWITRVSALRRSCVSASLFVAIGNPARLSETS